MDFSVKYINDVLIARLEIKKATFLEANQFEEFLNLEISNGHRKIVIDLSNCSLVDPVFLGTIILAYKKIINFNGTLKIIKPKLQAVTNENFKRSFEIFESYDSLNEALLTFQKVLIDPSQNTIPDRLLFTTN